MNNSENILIAQFMGMTIQGNPTLMLRDDNGRNEIVPVASLDYDTSWNSLMPVVEKIESTLDMDGYRYTVEISKTLCIIWSDGDCVTSQMRGHEGLTKIDAVCSAVVEFIKAER
tara:strand:+ start:842 stop:1183 length:342 start_codon:yes stop_codon:yes gene_type:complete